MAIKPIPGYDYNPLAGWPRNEPCFCASGKKAKKCHLPTLNPIIKASEASKLYEFMKAKRAGKKVTLIIENTPDPQPKETL